MTLSAWWLSMSGRRLVPLLLFAFALLAMGLRYGHQMGAIAQDVAESETSRLRERLGIDQARLDIRLGMDERLLLRRLVGSMALHEGLEQAFLVDAQGQVLASLGRQDLGRNIVAVLRDRELMDRLGHWVTAPPPPALEVRKPAEGGGLAAAVPLQDRHQLLVWQDLSRSLALRRAAVQRELAYEALMVLGAASVLALMLHGLWFRRARLLAQTLASIGAGDLSVRSRLQGRDELAHIGAAADRMAEQLQHDQGQLRYLQALINRSPLVVIEWRNQPGWPVIFVSESVALWGYRPADLLDGRLQYNDLIHPDDVQRVNREIEQYFAAGPDTYRQEYRIRRADGGWAWVDDRTSLTRDAQGAVQGISGVLMDITAQREAELAQREQAEQLRMFYELPFLGMAISSPVDKRWLQVNDQLCDMLGYAREELLRMTWAEMTPPGDLERNVALFDELLAGQRDGYRLNKRFVRKDGGIVHAEIDVRAVRDEVGQVRQLFATIQDVTEHHRYEQALQQVQDQMLKAQRLGKMGSWTIDLRSRRFIASPQALVIYGADPERPELTLEEADALVVPEDRELVRAVVRRGVGTGEPCDLRCRVLNPVRGVRHLHVRAEFEREDGQVVRCIGMVLDETDLVEAQRERDRLVSVLETTSDIVSMADPRGRVFYFNRAGHEMLGLPSGAPLDDVIRRVHPPWAAQLVHEQGIPAAVREGRWLGETAVLDAQGREVPMSQLIMSHRGADGQVEYLWTILRDISERVMADQALRDAKDMLEQGETVVHMGSMAYDSETGALNWSRQAFATIGLPWSAQPPSIDEYCACIHPDDVAQVRASIDGLVAGADVPEVRYRTHPDRGPVRWLRRVYLKIERAQEGLKPRYIGTLQDITEVVEAEDRLRRVNQELEHRVAERTAQLSQANQELEAFSYTVSHDLKAPLRGIDGYSQLLVEEFGEKLGNEGRDFVRRIRHGVELMGELINDLLAYSRMERRDMARDAVALLPLVQQVLDGYGDDIRRLDVQVQIELAPVTLALDREGMAVVLRNLIGNALKFSRDRQPPRLEIGGRREAGCLTLWVRDNGVGFDMKYHDRMFGIFQRLHRAEEFPGTGVGLALVAKAVQRMGGRVWAEGSLGQGATFFLEFPE